MKKVRNGLIKNLHYFCLIGVIALGLMTIVGTGGGGGGGGSSSESEPSESSVGITFKLTDPDRSESGYTISMSLTGTDSEGYNYRLSARLTTLDETTYEGQAVIPTQEIDVFENIDAGWVTTTIWTTYYDADTKEPIIRIDNEGKEDTPISISLLPETGEIGDFGSLTSWQLSDGSYYTQTWELEDVGHGLANLIIYRTIKDSDGDITGTRKATWTIDENGDRRSVSIVMYLVDYDSTLELSGNVTSSATVRFGGQENWDYDSKWTENNELLKNLFLFP